MENLVHRKRTLRDIKHACVNRGTCFPSTMAGSQDSQSLLPVLYRDHHHHAPKTPQADELVKTVSRLENRCDALEGCLRAESDGADAEKARAKESEAKFNRLLVWARAEEERRRQAEQRLSRTREEGKVLEARIKVVEKEVRGYIFDV